MSEVFPTEASLLRTIQEGVPRDWFAYLDVQSNEEWAVIHRGRRRIPFPYSSPGPEISPAVIQALLQPKVSMVLRMILDVVAATRLTTSVGDDVDSWGYQLYQDFLVRRPAETDTDYKARIRCLIRHPVDANPDHDLHFLPSPTETGVAAYLGCFGYLMTVSETYFSGVLKHGVVYGSDIVTPPGAALTGHLPNGYRSEGDPASQSPPIAGNCVDMVYSGSAVVATVPNATTDQERAIVRSLFRRSRVFGVNAQLVFPK